jgi:hypothetical protein
MATHSNLLCLLILSEYVRLPKTLQHRGHICTLTPSHFHTENTLQAVPEQPHHRSHKLALQVPPGPRNLCTCQNCVGCYTCTPPQHAVQVQALHMHEDLPPPTLPLPQFASVLTSSAHRPYQSYPWMTTKLCIISRVTKPPWKQNGYGGHAALKLEGAGMPVNSQSC